MEFHTSKFHVQGCHDTACGDSDFCCALQQLISLDVLIVLLDPGLSEPPDLSSVDPQLKGIMYMLGVFNPRSFLMWQRKLAMLLDGRPAVLICLDSALLMQLKVGQRKGKWATDVRTCQDVSSILD
jgi:hypothetical protein